MASAVSYLESPAPSFLFDLDGTLIDSVYQHVIAWRTALTRIGIDLSVWRIHRRIGMSGGLFVSALLRETGRSLSKEDIDALQQAHAAEYRAQADSVTPLPGARELLAALTDAGVRWAIATSGYAATARPALALLGLPEDTPMITRDLVRHAKPDPDLFLAAAAELGVDPRYAMVVGDSVWDLLAARRAGALGVGLLSGGYGREELERAGRVPGLRRPGRDARPHRRARRPRLVTGAVSVNRPVGTGPGPDSGWWLVAAGAVGSPPRNCVRLAADGAELGRGRLRQPGERARCRPPGSTRRGRAASRCSSRRSRADRFGGGAAGVPVGGLRVRPDAALWAWRRLRPAWVLGLAGVVFGGLWIAQYYGPQAMPDMWSALGSLAAVGFFLRWVGSARSWIAGAGLAGRARRLMRGAGASG